MELSERQSYDLPHRLSPFLRLGGGKPSGKRSEAWFATLQVEYCSGGRLRAFLLKCVCWGFWKDGLKSGLGGRLGASGQGTLDAVREVSFNGLTGRLEGSVQGALGDFREASFNGLTGVQIGGAFGSPGTGMGES